jgi:hypothetical protein
MKHEGSLKCLQQPAIGPPSVAQLLKNFPTHDGILRFITVFTRTLHWSLSRVRSIQSIPPHPISLRSILILSSYLSRGLPSGVFSSGFPAKILYAFPFSPMRATCSDHRTVLDLIIPQLYFLMIHYNVILSFKFFYQNSVTIFNTSHTCHMTRHVIFLSLIFLTICGEATKSLVMQFSPDSRLSCYVTGHHSRGLLQTGTPLDTWSFESGLRHHAGMECPSFHRHLERWRQ